MFVRCGESPPVRRRAFLFFGLRRGRVCSVFSGGAINPSATSQPSLQSLDAFPPFLRILGIFPKLAHFRILAQDAVERVPRRFPQRIGRLAGQSLGDGGNVFRQGGRGAPLHRGQHLAGGDGIAAFGHLQVAAVFGGERDCPLDGAKPAGLEFVLDPVEGVVVGKTIVRPGSGVAPVDPANADREPGEVKA